MGAFGYRQCGAVINKSPGLPFLIVFSVAVFLLLIWASHPSWYGPETFKFGIPIGFALFLYWTIRITSADHKAKAPVGSLRSALVPWYVAIGVVIVLVANAPFWIRYADDASFDGAVCAPVFHHIRNREQLLGELRRVLRPGGWLLVSTSHPTADWRHFGGSYFSRDWSDLVLAGGEHSIHYQRTPLESFMSELLGAGFVLEQLVEPRPTPALREVDEARYDKLRRTPSFLAVRLRRP